MPCGIRRGSLLRRNGNLRDCKHPAQNHHTKDRKTRWNGTAHGDLFLKRTMKHKSFIIIDSLYNRETSIFRRELLPHLRWFPASSLDVRQADDLAPNTSCVKCCVPMNRLRRSKLKPLPSIVPAPNCEHLHRVPRPHVNNSPPLVPNPGWPCRYPF